MDFCVSSLFLHLCSISLPLIIIFFKLIVFGVSFSQAQGKLILSLKKIEFFLPFGFCPPKVGLVVCTNFLQDDIGAEFLFVCFFICLCFL